MADIQIKSLGGQEFGGYIATPVGGVGPGVIIIQEIFGVNAAMRTVCDTFAKNGFIAVCPDLFWRQERDVQISDSDPSEWEHAFDLYKAFDIEAGVRDLLSTLAFLRRYSGCNGMVGAVGYSLGGKLAYLMATRSDVECSVSYYGMGIEAMLDEVSDIRMPLLMHIAEQDKFVPAATRQKILFAMSRNPVIHAELYAGVEHAFARPEGVNYNEASTKTANDRTYAFLRDYLCDRAK